MRIFSFHLAKTTLATSAHAFAAMVERKRQDFQHEFTTLRFRALSERGAWQGHSDIVPNSGGARG